MLKIEKYEKNPVYVDAVQVTAENMAEAAAWCGGTIVPATETEPTHITGPVSRPYTERQKKAFVGDWILRYNGFKFYTHPSFMKSFVKIKFLTKQEADAANIHPPIEPRK